MSTRSAFLQVATSVLKTISGPTPPPDNILNADSGFFKPDDDLPLGSRSALRICESSRSYQPDPLNRPKHEYYRGVILCVNSPSGNDKLSLKGLQDRLRIVSDLETLFITARIKDWQPERKLGLDEGFGELGRLLNIMGEKYLPFERWEKLTIETPDVEVLHDKTVSPMIPLDPLTNLRHLIWTGHAKQMVSSWLPLSPPFLQQLHILKITSNIAIEDFLYILCHIRQMTSLHVKSIKNHSLVTPVFPVVNVPSKQLALPMMDDLSVDSDPDLCPILQSFHFPSLHHLNLRINHPTGRWEVHELDTFIWRQLKSFNCYIEGLGDEELIASHLMTLCDPSCDLRMNVIFERIPWSPYTHYDQRPRSHLWYDRVYI